MVELLDRVYRLDLEQEKSVTFRREILKPAFGLSLSRNMRIPLLLLALLLSGCGQDPAEQVERVVRGQPVPVPYDPSALALTITLADDNAIAASAKIEVDLSTAKATILVGTTQATELSLSQENIEPLRRAWKQVLNDSPPPGPWPSDSSPVSYRLEIDGAFFGEYPGHTLSTQEMACIENLLESIYRRVPPEIGTKIESSFTEQTTHSLQKEPVNDLVRSLRSWNKVNY